MTTLAICARCERELVAFDDIMPLRDGAGPFLCAGCYYAAVEAECLSCGQRRPRVDLVAVDLLVGGPGLVCAACHARYIS